MSSWVYFSEVRISRAGGLNISSVDFGCFSTYCGDCEALEEREEQKDFTLFLLCRHLVRRSPACGKEHNTAWDAGVRLRNDRNEALPCLLPRPACGEGVGGGEENQRQVTIKKT